MTIDVYVYVHAENDHFLISMLYMYIHERTHTHARCTMYTAYMYAIWTDKNATPGTETVEK